MQHLVSSIEAVFDKLNLKRIADWEAVGGRAGVGAPLESDIKPSPIWTEAQLGMIDGTAPKTLANGTQGKVQGQAAESAMARLTEYLDIEPFLPETPQETKGY